MADKGKVAVIMLILLLIISLSLAGGIFYLFQKERAANLALQEQLAEIRAAQKVTQGKLDESNRTIAQLESKLKETTTQIEKLNNDLQQEKMVKEEALSQIGQLKISLEQQKGLRADLENKLNLAQRDAEKIQVRLKGLEAKKAELEVRVKGLEEKEGGVESVELGTVVVTPEPQATPSVEKTKERVSEAKGIEGKILVVNKEYNFAVINLGSKDGVGMADVFSIYHENKYIGDVKVEKVHDSMAAAGFLTDEIKNKVSEGDQVVKKTK